MLAVEDGVLVLPGRVDDFGEVVLVLVTDCLGESVFDRGVVAIYEVSVDELHRQRRFACEASLAGDLRVGMFENLPTARLPTMASLRCLGAALGMLTVGTGIEKLAKEAIDRSSIAWTESLSFEK